MFILDCDLPKVVTGILSTLYKSVLYLVPIAIVLFGVIDFLKAVSAQKEDTIKNSTSVFIKRIITGLLVFFIFSLVNWIFGSIIKNVGNAGNAMECAAQILSGKTSNSNNNQNSNNNDDSTTNSNTTRTTESSDACYARIFNECIKRTSGSDAEKICKSSANNSCKTNNWFSI